MKVIVAGAGEVGFQLAKLLSAENIDVVVLDKNKDRLQRLSDTMNVVLIEGEGGSPSGLKDAGAEEADMLLAVTDNDEVNMMACLVAKVMFQVPRSIARLRNPEYFSNDILLQSLGIKPAINPEIEAAKAVIRLIEVPFAATIEDFEGGKIRVFGFKIPHDSSLAGKTVNDLNLTKPRILVGAIQREDKVIIPAGNDTLEKTDTIYLLAKREDVASVCNSISESSRPVRRIMIAGGGSIGFYVAQALEEQNLSVKIIEKDAERYKFLLNILKKSVIIHGDGSDQKLLEKENVNDMDVFAAISNNEDLNIMSAMLAKSLGAKKVIAVVNRTECLSRAYNLGIDVVLSPRITAAETILKYVRSGNILSLTTVAGGKAGIMEVAAENRSSLIGKTSREVELPQKTLIGAIIRNNNIIIPSGEDKIINNDKLIIFILHEAVKQAEKLLG